MFSSDKWFCASAGFYPETIGQSLRFEDGDSPYLDRTPSSETDRDKFTWSCWIKRTVLDQLLVIFQHGPSNNNSTGLFLETDNTLVYQHADGGGATDKVQTNAKLRDITGFYHIALAVDTTQSTDSNRVRLYINGVYQSSLATANYPTQNTDTDMNTTNKFRISGQTAGTQFPFDGYMAEVNFLDGIQVGDTQDSNGDYILDEFGETKNGVWIPKAYSGSYGTNGFRLTFADSSSLGDDTSGNGNDFTSSGLASTDVVIDSPTNNFCTLNPLSGNSHTATLSEGALKASGNDQAAIGTFGMTTGKWYWEGRCGTIGSGGSNFIGIVKMDYSEKNQGSSHTYGRTYSNNGSVYTVAVTSFATGTSYTTGDIIGVAVDMDNGTIVWYKNGTENTNSEVTDLNSHVDGDQGWLPWVNFGNATGDFVLNFGQDSTFAGLETAQNNSDGNGNGDFYYSPPSGYFALCTDNLNEPTISPSKSSQADDHFDTITYNGSASNQTITTNFQADFLWFKERTTNGIDHNLFDSSRLHSTTSAKFGKKLESNTSDAETDSTAIVSQSTNDITLLGGVSTTNDQYSRTYVMWHWKANGGTTSSNTEGSLSCTVQANTTAGISIVTWDGDGNTSVTLGHGLEKKPEVIIYKGRDNSFSWPTWFKTFGTSTGSFINTTNQPGSFARVTSEPTATVIPNAEKNYTNVSGEKDIAYVFHSVDGFSRIGLYTGNGSTDGTFINLGFRPAWVIIKKSSGSGNWCIFDNKQNPDNPVNIMLLADTNGNTSAGGTGDNLDFLSNGFKIRDNSSGRNTNGGEYIYMAFAEQPFKFSNAR